MNLLDTKVNPNCLVLYYYHRQRERERERERESRRGGGSAGSGGAMVLGKLSVPRRPTNLDYNRARASCACSRCGWVFLGILF